MIELTIHITYGLEDGRENIYHLHWEISAITKYKTAGADGNFFSL